MDTGRLVDLIINNNPDAVRRNLLNVGLLYRPNASVAEIYQVIASEAGRLGPHADPFLFRMLNVPTIPNAPGAREIMDIQTEMDGQGFGTFGANGFDQSAQSSFSSNESGFQLYLNWKWETMLKVLGIGILALVFIRLFIFTFFRR